MVYTPAAWSCQELFSATITEEHRGILIVLPVRPLDEYKRLNAHFGRLPQMRADVEELKRQVRELLARVDGGT